MIIYQPNVVVHTESTRLSKSERVRESKPTNVISFLFFFFGGGEGGDVIAVVILLKVIGIL